MLRVIIHNGIKYFENKRNYFCNNIKRDGIERYLHRRIWQEHNGDIPKGMLIHHINENPEDNRIENLQLMSRSDHQSMHTKKLFDNPEYRKKNKEHILKLINSKEFKEKSAVWIKSKEGKSFYSKANLHWVNSTQHPCICKKCGKTFLSRKKTKPFCRDACRVSFLRKSKYNDPRKCCICNKEFLAYKWGNVQHCSRKCSAVSMIKTRMQTKL